ncbi:MAG: T9SS type A sorting domain-containing protein [Bacteroidia bacterium]|nr:T9SS type A sorting domain-containing protein [Bacteroidia bacterium]
MKRILLTLFLSVGIMSLGAFSTLASDIDGDKLKLGQNYPNPAIGKTYIEVVFEGEATLSIYNVVGKLVETQTVTSNMITLDVSNYTEGIYLYTLESNGEKITKRMTVRKP